MQRARSVAQQMRRLREQVKQTVRTAAAASTGPTINVTRRTNLVVRANVGEPGSVCGATATQDAPIDQSGNGAAQKEKGES